MSTRIIEKVLGAAAVAIGAAGLLTVSVPASAMPPLPLVPSPDCDWIVFSTGSDLNQGNGTVVHIEWGRSGGTASYSSQGYEWSGSLTGPVIVKGTNELVFSVAFREIGTPFGEDARAAPTNNYSGSIDPGGTASGTWNNNSGASGTWTMGNTFKCIGKAPAPAAPAPAAPEPASNPPQEAAPTDAISVRFDKIPRGVSVNVTNSSSVKGDCTYDATTKNLLVPPFHKDFSVGANGTASFDITGIKTGASYATVTQCTGTWQGATVVIGRREQTTTF